MIADKKIVTLVQDYPIAEEVDPHNCKGVKAPDYQGFFPFPRSLFNDPRYQSMPPKHQKVLNIIFFNLAYKPQKFNFNGNIIPILPGQFCCSYERLVQLCNVGVKRKSDMIDKSLVQRAVSSFRKLKLSLCQPIQGVNVFTCLHPEVCDSFKMSNDTAIDTQSIRTRYTKEECNTFFSEESSPSTSEATNVAPKFPYVLEESTATESNLSASSPDSANANPSPSPKDLQAEEAIRLLGITSEESEALLSQFSRKSILNSCSALKLFIDSGSYTYAMGTYADLIKRYCTRKNSCS